MKKIFLTLFVFAVVQVHAETTQERIARRKPIKVAEAVIAQQSVSSSSSSAYKPVKSDSVSIAYLGGAVVSFFNGLLVGQIVPIFAGALANRVAHTAPHGSVNTLGLSVSMVSSFHHFFNMLEAGSLLMGQTAPVCEMLPGRLVASFIHAQLRIPQKVEVYLDTEQRRDFEKGAADFSRISRIVNGGLSLITVVAGLDVARVPSARPGVVPATVAVASPAPIAHPPVIIPAIIPAPIAMAAPALPPIVYPLGAVPTHAQVVAGFERTGKSRAFMATVVHSPEPMDPPADLLQTIQAGNGKAHFSSKIRSFGHQELLELHRLSLYFSHQFGGSSPDVANQFRADVNEFISNRLVEMADRGHLHQGAQRPEVGLTLHFLQKRTDMATRHLLALLEPRLYKRLSYGRDDVHQIGIWTYEDARLYLERRLNEHRSGVRRVSGSYDVDSLAEVELFIKEREREPKQLPYLYHCTPQDAGLQGIVGGKIQVLHQRAYKGAFVSMREPALGYGDYCFGIAEWQAFWQSALPCTLTHGDLWLGCGEAVPMNNGVETTALCCVATSKPLSDRAFMTVELIDKCKINTDHSPIRSRPSLEFIAQVLGDIYGHYFPYHCDHPQVDHH